MGDEPILAPFDMTVRSAARPGGTPPSRTVLVAGAVAVGAIAVEAVAGVLLISAIRAGAPAPASTAELVVLTVAELIPAYLGLLILSRTHDNPVGWLLIGITGEQVISDLNQSYALLTFFGGHPGLPAAAVSAAIANFSWAPWYGILAVLALLFPTGRPINRRWRWAVVASVASTGLLYATLVAEPWGMDAPFAKVQSPMPVGWLETTGGKILFDALWVASLAMLFVAAASLVVRFRRSTGVVRYQIKWFAYAGCMVPLLLTACGVVRLLLPVPVPVALAMLDVGVGSVMLAIPVVTAVAILRYHLYGIDRLINQTLVYAVLTVLLGAGFTGLVLVGGAFTGRGSGAGVGVATFASVVVFRPLRDRVQRDIDRRFNHGRYEALRIVRDYLRQVGSDRLPRENVADMLSRSLGDPSARVVFVQPDTGRWIDARGADSAAPEATPDSAVTPIGRGGSTIGVLVHNVSLASERFLLDSVLAAARLPLDNARLQAEVRASRARIVAAGYERQRRIERDLHDGAQQRLVALALRLRLAEGTLSDASPQARQIFDHTVDELATSVEELRALSRGLLPAALADDSLRDAVAALCRRTSIQIDVNIDDFTDRPLPPGLQAAAYFLVSEAVTNAVKHSGADRVQIRIRDDQERLRIEVRDHGIGGARLTAGGGLTGLVERIDTHAGRLRIDSPPGVGTTVTAELPWSPNAAEQLTRPT